MAEIHNECVKPEFPDSVKARGPNRSSTVGTLSIKLVLASTFRSRSEESNQPTKGCLVRVIEPFEAASV